MYVILHQVRFECIIIDIFCIKTSSLLTFFLFLLCVHFGERERAAKRKDFAGLILYEMIFIASKGMYYFFFEHVVHPHDCQR